MITSLTSLRTILGHLSGKTINPRTPLPRLSVCDKERRSYKEIQVSALGSLEFAPVYHVARTVEGKREPVGATFDVSPIYTIRSLLPDFSHEIGFLFLDNQGVLCYDASGGGPLLFASRTAFDACNENAIERRLPFECSEFSTLSIEGLWSIFRETDVIPLETFRHQGQIDFSGADGMGLTFKAQNHYIAASRFQNVSRHDIVSGTETFLQPVWNREAFQGSEFNPRRARLVALIERKTGDLSDA
jgi:hypothetical protein